MKKRLLLLLLALLGVPILLFGIYLIVIFVDAFVDELEADAALATGITWCADIVIRYLSYCYFC
ncbi:MAG: hypothetical protein JETCAE02_03970 [Anaerolineaceae bacterium]|nr:MAG: hypothetical protein JETCAE02_03970 [Anaerolineaceae bacterium]